MDDRILEGHTDDGSVVKHSTTYGQRSIRLAPDTKARLHNEDLKGRTNAYSLEIVQKIVRQRRLELH